MAIVKIPIDFYNQARTDPNEFARNYICVPRGSISPFFQDRVKVSACYDWNKINPFNSSTMMFDKKFECKDDFNRYIHLDIGIKNNAFGVSMCHVSHFVTRKIYDDLSNTSVDLLMPFIRFDFLGKVFAPSGTELFLPEIRNLIIYELAKRGFHIRLITADRFSSMETLQTLQADGYVCGSLSLDRTTSKVLIDFSKKEKIRRESTEGKFTAAWDSLREVIYDDRIRYPYLTDFEEEVKHAERRVKNNHVSVISPSAGLTLDLLESMAGSVFNAINNEHESKFTEDMVSNEFDRGQDFYKKIGRQQKNDDFYSDIFNESIDSLQGEKGWQ